MLIKFWSSGGWLEWELEDEWVEHDVCGFEAELDGNHHKRKEEITNLEDDPNHMSARPS